MLSCLLWGPWSSFVYGLRHKFSNDGQSSSVASDDGLSSYFQDGDLIQFSTYQLLHSLPTTHLSPLSTHLPTHTPISLFTYTSVVFLPIYPHILPILWSVSPTVTPPSSHPATYHPSTHPPTHQGIPPSFIHPAIHPSFIFHLPTHPFICPPLHLPLHPPTHPSIQSSIHPTLHPLSCCLS